MKGEYAVNFRNIGRDGIEEKETKKIVGVNGILYSWEMPREGCYCLFMRLIEQDYEEK